MPGDYQKSGLVYALSKKFVCKYAQMCAFSYGEKGIRVVSLSPGLIGTGAAWPLYQRILKKEREKAAPEILQLSDEK